MHLYRQPILIFGIVAPIVVATAVVGCCYVLKAKMVASYDNKQRNYKTYEAGRFASLEIESQVSRQHLHMERWSSQLSEETASTVTTRLREIAEHLPKKEYQLTAFDPSNTKVGFGATSAQKSTQLRIAFRGSFRTMQRAFLELETQMPQLQLQDLKIDPTSQSSLLNFQVAYTAWEN